MKTLKEKSFPRTFWVSNIMELFERWGWYGIFAVLALYLTQSTDTGALGFSQNQKGYVLGIVTAILYVLPTITGAIADKYGYKKTLLVAYSILLSGYFLIGFFSSYIGFFIVFLYIAIGAALFKPIVSATIQKTTNENNASLGFGLFYMIVNIGAFIGPLVASFLRVYDWKYIFYFSGSTIGLNMILLLFYKEPAYEKKTGSLKQEIKKILQSVSTALKDIHFFIFLLIIAGFWTMYNQLFYTMPNFIDQWMDTRPLYQAMNSLSPWLAEKLGSENGTVLPERIINIDAGYIILFQIIITLVIKRLKPLWAMILGIFICTTGLTISFLTQNALILVSTILLFAVGEMSVAPKIFEYIGKIAPKNKVAMYMGCSFIPMGIANFLSGFISGNVYTFYSDKLTILKHYLTQKNIAIPEITDSFTQNQFYNYAENALQLNTYDLNTLLWNHYKPYEIAYIFAGIGIVSAISLLVFDKTINKKNNSKLA